MVPGTGTQPTPVTEQGGGAHNTQLHTTLTSLRDALGYRGASLELNNTHSSPLINESNKQHNETLTKRPKSPNQSCYSDGNCRVRTAMINLLTPRII